MKIPVYTDEQFDEVLSGRVKPGIYEFTVVEAEEKVSQAGNKMIEMHISVSDGINECKIRDFITFVEYPTEAEYPVKVDFNKKVQGHFFSVRNMKSLMETLGIRYAGELSARAILNKKGTVKVILGEEVKEGKHQGKRFLEVDKFVKQPAQPNLQPSQQVESVRAATVVPVENLHDKKNIEDIPF